MVFSSTQFLPFGGPLIFVYEGQRLRFAVIFPEIERLKDQNNPAQMAWLFLKFCPNTIQVSKI
jgi:hypothetical protein